MELQKIKDKFSDEFEQLNNTILSYISSEGKLLNELQDYYKGSTGKQIRALCLFEVCSILDVELDHNVIKLAATIELLHNATIIHDDVVDVSDYRRGKATINHTYGNKIAILLGDYMYSKTFQLLTELNNLEIYRLFANATNMLAKGELMQLSYQYNPDLGMDPYLSMIYQKTGILFSLAFELAAIKAGNNSLRPILAKLGSDFGTIFQLVDDQMDFQSTHRDKPRSQDLMQGKITLPTLYYLEQNPLNQAEIKLIQNKDQKFLKQLQDNIIASGVLEKTKDIIKDYNSKFTSELKTKFPKANDLAILCAQTLTTIL